MKTEILISETLSKALSLDIESYDSKDVYLDEDGSICIDECIKDLNLLEEYKYSNCTLEDLLKKVSVFLSDILPQLNEKDRRKASYYSNQCKNWEQDECEVVLN